MKSVTYKEFTLNLTEEGFGDDTPYRVTVISPDGISFSTDSHLSEKHAFAHAEEIVNWIDRKVTDAVVNAVVKIT